MKPSRLLGPTLTAAVLLAGILAIPAHALPEFLPITGANKGFTSKDTSAGVFENTAGTKIECGTGKASGGFETDTLGTFHLEYEKCKAQGFSCNTEGDAAELILSEGSFHFVYDVLGAKDEQEGGSLGIAILFLPRETLFNCTGGLIKNKFKGTYLCLILQPLTSSITHEYHCLKGKNAGEAGEKIYWNDNGTAVTAQFLSSLNGGEFKETNLQRLATVTTASAGAWMNE